MSAHIGFLRWNRVGRLLISCETWVGPFEGFNRPERSERVGQLSAEIF